jgi:hypothetical protein
MSDEGPRWSDAPDWLRPSRFRVWWIGVRVRLHRGLWVPLPPYVAYCPDEPTGLRRLVSRFAKLA